MSNPNCNGQPFLRNLWRAPKMMDGTGVDRRRSSVAGVDLSGFRRTVPIGRDAFDALVCDRTNLWRPPEPPWPIRTGLPRATPDSGSSSLGSDRGTALRSRRGA